MCGLANVQLVLDSQPQSVPARMGLALASRELGRTLQHCGTRSTMTGVERRDRKEADPVGFLEIQTGTRSLALAALSAVASRDT
jgi:hypothetical protein